MEAPAPYPTGPAEEGPPGPRTPEERAPERLSEDDKATERLPEVHAAPGPPEDVPDPEPLPPLEQLPNRPSAPQAGPAAAPPAQPPEGGPGVFPPPPYQSGGPAPRQQPASGEGRPPAQEKNPSAYQGPTYATGGYPAVGEDGLTPPPSADSLKADTLVRGRQQNSGTGWRKALHLATFGMVNPGESAAELQYRERMAKIKTPVAGGHYRLAVLSLKGGVGKTTTTVALGSTLASLRGDRVLAVDANPDRGTLSDKVRLESAATIRDLLNEKHLIQRYADFRAFTSQAPSRLEVLASDRDPAVSEAFSEDDYRQVANLLEHYYSICITDCGTGLLHSAMRGVLGLADQIVLVSSPSVDGARSASATLDWLDAHEYRHLVHGAVVVLSMVRPKGKSSVDLDQLEDHFRQRCREVVRVPWDSHLEEGAEVDLDRLHPATRSSYLHLAASVGEAFAWPR